MENKKETTEEYIHKLVTPIFDKILKVPSAKEVKKEVKKNKEEFLLNIISLINQGLNPSQISKNLSVSKQKLHYYTKQLEEKGLIGQVGYGVWEVNNEEVKKSSLGTNHKPTTNLHAFQIRFPILEGKIQDKDWIVKERLNNWIPKYLTQNIMGGITIKNNNNKSLTVWLKTRNLNELNEVYDLGYKVRAYIYDFFKKEGKFIRLYSKINNK